MFNFSRDRKTCFLFKFAAIMKDPAFINTMLQKGKEADAKVQTEFSDLPFQPLNWRPGPDQWSIAQCLDHLVVTDSTYFPALQKIAEGKYKMSAWERFSPFSGLCGRLMVNRITEQVHKKMIAPRVFQPSVSLINMGITERFHTHLQTLLDYIARCEKEDLDKIIITSPSLKIVTYSLRNTIKILLQHEWRHIYQALRVKMREEFPKTNL
jgi:hypothetical protein